MGACYRLRTFIYLAFESNQHYKIHLSLHSASDQVLRRLDVIFLFRTRLRAFFHVNTLPLQYRQQHS